MHVAMRERVMIRDRIFDRFFCDRFLFFCDRFFVVVGSDHSRATIENHQKFDICCKVSRIFEICCKVRPCNRAFCCKDCKVFSLEVGSSRKRCRQRHGRCGRRCIRRSAPPKICYRRERPPIWTHSVPRPTPATAPSSSDSTVFRRRKQQHQ